MLYLLLDGIMRISWILLLLLILPLTFPFKVFGAHYADTEVAFSPGDNTGDTNLSRSLNVCDNKNVSLGDGGEAEFGFLIHQL